MLKITIFSASLLFMPKNKWALTNLSVLILGVLTLPFIIDKTMAFTPSNLLMTDPISFSLIVLSVWLTSLMLVASSGVTRTRFKPSWFITLVLILLTLLIITFSISNMFLFYLFFEATLIPTLMLIIGWGYQPERIQAGIYMLFYTLAASLPLLMMIFWLKTSFGSLNFYMIMLLECPNLTFLGYLAAVGAFLVKMPMFLLHLWLPKAHVEAPVSGSMVLAGVLLKLGGYGLLRMGPVFFNQFLTMSLAWITVSMVGGTLVSFMCLRQTDTKSLVAYSSVAHMSLVIAGVMSGSKTGATGCLALMIAHGLCSSGMFCLTNIVFERTSSRNMLLCKGLMQIMPSMALWWFLLCICNMAAPPSINLMSEILLINSIISWSMFNMAPLMIMSFMSAAFTLFLFASTQHGHNNSSVYGISSGSVNEYVLLGLHWVPINIMILKADLFIL